MKRKPNKSFYISVEGDTEKWYLGWLQKQINLSDDFEFKAIINSKVQKDPVSYVKTCTYVSNSEKKSERRKVWHFCDYESAEPIHSENFKRTMDRMRQAEEIKPITYYFGYSNFTFDLWIVLHKIDCFEHFTNRKQYIQKINKAFDVKFADMDEYKHEGNFKSLLAKCTLDDVIAAIERTTLIQFKNQEAGYIKQEYRGFQYYHENPSLMIGQAIKSILEACGYKRVKVKK